ncbi:hypothetical protein SDC9_167581 [bioreactor metagenome]|uniref:Uncharacterized protein n=1 Tax=bioreactor metagenome TaxID=1076179 RepID=A0A645G8F4_9ZZZZ
MLRPKPAVAASEFKNAVTGLYIIIGEQPIEPAEFIDTVFFMKKNPILKVSGSGILLFYNTAFIHFVHRIFPFLL